MGRYAQWAMGREITADSLICATCGADSVIQIELKLADGTEVDFYSCHQCETRWWNQNGEDLGLDDVLDLASRPRTLWLITELQLASHW